MPGQDRADLEVNDERSNPVTGTLISIVRRDTVAYAASYLERAFSEEWPHLRFHWSGAGARGESYYYRIAGRRLLIEHDNRSGGTHVHAAWRDAERDFGGR